MRLAALDSNISEVIRQIEYLTSSSDHIQSITACAQFCFDGNFPVTAIDRSLPKADGNTSLTCLCGRPLNIFSSFPDPCQHAEEEPKHGDIFHGCRYIRSYFSVGIQFHFLELPPVSSTRNTKLAINASLIPARCSWKFSWNNYSGVSKDTGTDCYNQEYYFALSGNYSITARLESSEGTISFTEVLFLTVNDPISVFGSDYRFSRNNDHMNVTLIQGSNVTVVWRGTNNKGDNFEGNFGL